MWARDPPQPPPSPMPSLQFFDSVRPVRLRVIVLFVALHVLLKALFFSRWFYVSLAQPIEMATAGVITPIVLAGLIVVVALLAIVMGGLGKLGLSDLGLRGNHVLNAALIALLVWGGVQSVLSGLAASGHFDAALNPALAHGPARFVGKLLEATLGSAFIEEVMYRGFLVPQVYLLARRWTARSSTRAAIAIVVPQLYFGLHHVPAALRMHLPAWEAGTYIFHVVLVGFLFTALYLRTGNLFVAIAAHALVNFPAPVIVAGVDPSLPSLLALIGVCLLLLAWPALNRRLGDVFTMVPSAAPTPEPTHRAA